MDIHFAFYFTDEIILINFFVIIYSMFYLIKCSRLTYFLRLIYYVNVIYGLKIIFLNTLENLLLLFNFINFKTTTKETN